MAVHKTEVGEYFYMQWKRHSGLYWRVWLKESENSNKYIKEFSTKEEAKKLVWELNGWYKPSNNQNQ